MHDTQHCLQDPRQQAPCDTFFKYFPPAIKLTPVYRPRDTELHISALTAAVSFCLAHGTLAVFLLLICVAGYAKGQSSLEAVRVCFPVFILQNQLGNEACVLQAL